MLAQQSGECVGIIIAQHHRKSKEGLAVQTGRTAEELDKEVKQVLLGVHSKGDHSRSAELPLLAVALVAV